MWRVVSSSAFINNALALDSTKSASLAFVRWRRKPRWLPVAKSKLFRVPERKPQNPEERAELLRLHNNYKTQMRSLRQFLREEVLHAQETTTADHIVLTPEQEEEEFQKCVDINDSWNQEIAALRAKRLEKEALERREYVAERLKLASLQKEEQMMRIEEIVRREKERAKHYITRENLDAAIEHALANPTDYNFAIDLNGNMYKGRDNSPGSAPGNVSVAEQQQQIASG